MEKIEQIVILAAGGFPTHEVPLQALREADHVICCDSAWYDWRLHGGPGGKDMIVIGDGDSLSDAEIQALGDRWIYIGEQDYNDLHKAMAYAVRRFNPCHSRYTILGATGRREDHTIGNISYLVTFAEEYPDLQVDMLTDYGRFTAFTGSRTFASFPRQQVSIFSLTPQHPVNGTGLRWPLDDFRALRWWNATLNSALGTSFTLASEGWIVVFQTYAPKP